MTETEFLTIATDHLRNHGFSLTTEPAMRRTSFPGRTNEELVVVVWNYEPATGMAALTQAEARPTLEFGLLDGQAWTQRFEVTIHYKHHSGGSNGHTTVFYLDGGLVKVKPW
jgi:hypothetical protein